MFSIVWMFCWSLCASGPPLRRIPTRQRFSAPLFFSTISWEIRVRARFMAASSISLALTLMVHLKKEKCPAGTRQDTKYADCTNSTVLYVDFAGLSVPFLKTCFSALNYKGCERKKQSSRPTILNEKQRAGIGVFLPNPQKNRKRNTLPMHVSDAILLIDSKKIGPGYRKEIKIWQI